MGCEAGRCKTYIFKVNNKDTRTMSVASSTVNFERISLYSTVNIIKFEQINAGCI